MSPLYTPYTVRYEAAERGRVPAGRSQFLVEHRLSTQVPVQRPAIPRTADAETRPGGSAHFGPVLVHRHAAGLEKQPGSARKALQGPSPVTVFRNWLCFAIRGSVDRSMRGSEEAQLTE